MTRHDAQNILKSLKERNFHHQFIFAERGKTAESKKHKNWKYNKYVTPL